MSAQETTSFLELLMSFDRAYVIFKKLHCQKLLAVYATELMIIFKN